MVLKITQQTFDEAVEENINDLGLSPEEAIEEAVNQFKAQGVDLSQVVTEPGAAATFQELKTLISDLKEPKGELSDLLVSLRAICDKGIQYRIRAGLEGAYDALIETFLKAESTTHLRVSVLKTLLSLMTKQPDLLEERGAHIILENLRTNESTELVKVTLKWCRESCLMHELNRQNFVELGIVELLDSFIKSGNNEIVRDVLAVLRALVLDDDVRVEFGKAHEHARIIASAVLSDITLLIKDNDDPTVVNDILLSLTSLLVRAEFCMTVDEVGGLDIINDTMRKFPTNEKIIRQCFKLLKALAGNDDCKAHVIQKGLAPVIVDALNTHKKLAATGAAGLGAIASLSLRNPDNSKAFYEASAPDAIVEVMRQHPKDKAVQRAGSWAIRNMVSRSRYQNKYFLELGAEELLKLSLVNFKEFEYDTKAALRDLECNVELKEEWTGRGGMISSEHLLKKE